MKLVAMRAMRATPATQPITIPAMAPPERPLEPPPLLAWRPAAPVAEVLGLGEADWRPGTSTSLVEVMGPPSSEVGTELVAEVVSATEEEEASADEEEGAADDSVVDGAAEDEGSAEGEGSALVVGSAEEVEDGGGGVDEVVDEVGSGSLDEGGCSLDDELVGAADDEGEGESDEDGAAEELGSAEDEGEGALELEGGADEELGSTEGCWVVDASTASDPDPGGEVKLGAELPSVPAPSAVSPVPIPDDWGEAIAGRVQSGKMTSNKPMSRVMNDRVCASCLKGAVMVDNKERRRAEQKVSE